jgi:cytochrome bd-type quinol oxidase subunit 2
MTGIAKHPMTLTWLVLVGATLALYALAEQTAVSRSAIAVVILIAAFKVRLVFLQFRELKSGAMPWRLVAEVWIGVVTAILLGACLATPSPLSP